MTHLYEFKVCWTLVYLTQLTLCNCAWVKVYMVTLSSLLYPHLNIHQDLSIRPETVLAPTTAAGRSCGTMQGPSRWLSMQTTPVVHKLNDVHVLTAASVT